MGGKEGQTRINCCFCLFLSAEFSTYHNYVRSLRFEEKPDYAYLRQLIRNLFHRQGFSYDYVFDWNLMKNVSNLLTSDCVFFSFLFSLVLVCVQFLHTTRIEFLIYCRPTWKHIGDITVLLNPWVLIITRATTSWTMLPIMSLSWAPLLVAVTTVIVLILKNVIKTIFSLLKILLYRTRLVTWLDTHL